jgi:putative peptidoglycan binding protein/L,D-transpeptidase-like protein/PKD domain-containing protein
MRRLLLLIPFLIWVQVANATPTVSIDATPVLGQAPLDVTLTARGDAVSYGWSFGDGSSAEGAVVHHRFEAGRYTATVTAVGADGTTAQASVVITALRLTLTGPKAGTYGRRATFKGRLVPAIPRVLVSLYSGETIISSTKADKKGRFHFRPRLTAPGTFTVRFGSVVSNPLAVPLRPGLDVALSRTAMLGQPLALRAVLRPRGSGTLDLRVWRSGRELEPRQFGDRAVLRLSTRRVANYVVRITVRPIGSYSGRTTTIRSSVYLPYLSLGARGASVRILEQRLAELHYALRGIDGYFADDTADAVLAFQKVHWMARTGRVDPAFWRRLRSAQVSWPRYRGSHHIEVDKTRQVLFEVDGGRVARIVHVSTGATGNTPVGRWRVYSKVPGFLPSGMFYSSFFLRGFAIHGYRSVPAYPASHGCVRTPLWIAPTLFASHSYGETVYVY